VYWLACLLRIATPASSQDAVPHALAAQAATAREALASGASAHIPQWIDRSDLPEYATYEQAVESLLDVLESTGQDALKFSTEIMIVPGYRIRSTHRLVTNFHMPGSTLLCIIEAAVGHIWRKAYAHAVKAGYRFLSYGDACLISFQPE
jgi:S-adenosylmethionine:tRNA ribosyltransferase-isomerase